MIGAAIPDLNRLDRLIDDHAFETLLGAPFSWDAFHTAGGSIVAALIGTLLVPSAYRRRVFALLAFGAASHLALDALMINPSGYSSSIFWPLTAYHPPTPNLYVSSDRWPALLAATAAAITRYLRYRRGTGTIEAVDSLRR